MNKYQKSLNTISDTLTYYMVRRDESLLHSDDEIYDAMAVLRKLVDNTDTPDEAPVSEKLPKKKYESTLFAEAFVHCDEIVINGKVVKADDQNSRRNV